MLKTSPIILVYNVDDNFVMGLVVSLYSTMENLSDGWRVQAHIIDGGLSAENKKRISDSLEFPNLQIIWRKISTDQANAFAEMDELPNRWPIVVNYRLLMPELLPDVDRAIYLDSDTMVIGDLAELWCYDLEGSLVGMTLLPGVNNVASQFGMKDYDRYGLDPATPYYASGVLLANLASMRVDGTVAKLMKFLERYHETVALPDLDALNVVLNGEINELDPSWQVILKGGRVRLKRILASFGMGSSPIIGAKLYHYTERKPWEYGCLNIYRDIFFQYLDKTKWAGWRPHRLKDMIEQVKFGSKKVSYAVKAKLKKISTD